MKKLYIILMLVLTALVLAACAPRAEEGTADPEVIEAETPVTDTEVAEDEDAEEEEEAEQDEEEELVSETDEVDEEQEVSAAAVEQTELTGDFVFETLLESVNEVPPVISGATGQAKAALTGNELVVHGTFRGLSSPLMEVSGTPAHIHLAPAGENGPVIFPLTVITSADQADDDIVGDEEGEVGYDPEIAEVLQDESNESGILRGEFELTEEQIDALMNGNFYVNIHTEEYPGGELRGQLTDTGL